MSNTIRLTEKQLKNIDTFNSSIKTLCKISTKLDPNNVLVDRVQKQVSMFLDYNPVDAIAIVTPFFTKYTNEVNTKNSDFFISGGIQSDLNSASKEILEIFKLIAAKWPTMTDAEKDIIWAKIHVMQKCINSQF